MIFTKFKRFIAILLCVVVLASFSLSAFAGSYSTLEYENINSIQESFVASFLSHCGIEVEFFNWDLDYSGSEFKNAAWCNLTRNFLNYIDNNDFKMSNKILDYASSCGIDSSIHGSTFVWDGSFKDCREIVDQLIYHLYNFLDSYENVYRNVDVPIDMYVGEYEEKFTGCYSRVTFSNALFLSDWYEDIGKSIQSYCTGDYVGDDFSNCYFNYVWDYGKLPLGYNTYLETLESYIDDYESSSGDSSGDSSDTSSDSSSDDTSSGDSSDSSDIEFNSIDVYYSSFYPYLFYSLLSSYDCFLFSKDFVSTEYVLSCVVDFIFEKMITGYFNDFYPNAFTDFKNIAHYEYENFVDTDVKYYQINFNATDSHKRFYFGFEQMFSILFNSGDDIYGNSTFLSCHIKDFLGLSLVMSFDTSCDIGKGNAFDTDWTDKFYNFSRTYNGPLLVTLYKDVDLYFIDYTWTSSFDNITRTFKVFDSYSVIKYHENQSSDSIEYWYYDKNAIYENWSDLIKIEFTIIPVPEDFGSDLLGVDLFVSYINGFFLWTQTFLLFLISCLTILPGAFSEVLVGGFLIIIVIRFLIK